MAVYTVRAVYFSVPVVILFQSLCFHFQANITVRAALFGVPVTWLQMYTIALQGNIHGARCLYLRFRVIASL